MTSVTHEVIQLESDEDSSPSPSNQTVNDLFLPEGAIIDTDELFNSQIDEILQSKPAFPQISALNAPERISQQGPRPRVLVNSHTENGVTMAKNSLPSQEDNIKSDSSNQNDAPSTSASPVKEKQPEATNEVVEPYYVDNEAMLFEALPREGSRLKCLPTTSVNFIFKCSFGKCQKVVKGDVNFVFHLWAHVSSTSSDLDGFQMENYLDMQTRNSRFTSNYQPPGKEFIVKCTECLLAFRDQIRLTEHYSKVHSYNSAAIKATTCHICEKHFGTTKALDIHLAQHKPNDAPYHCKICGYRTNLRANLIYHYSRSHRNSGYLMCPFCPFIRPVHKSFLSAKYWKIKKPLLDPEGFVQHMWDHAMKTKKSCNLCSISIISNDESPQCTMRRMEAHRNAHNYVVTSKNFRIIRTCNKRASYNSKTIMPKEDCEECKKQISSLLRINEKCPRCFRRIFWDKVEKSFGAKQGPPGSNYSCLECNFSTMFIERLTYHYEQTKHKFIVDSESEAQKMKEAADEMVESEGTSSKEEDSEKEMTVVTSAFEQCWEDSDKRNDYKHNRELDPLFMGRRRHSDQVKLKEELARMDEDRSSAFNELSAIKALAHDAIPVFAAFHKLLKERVEQGKKEKEKRKRGKPEEKGSETSKSSSSPEGDEKKPRVSILKPMQTRRRMLEEQEEDDEEEKAVEPDSLIAVDNEMEIDIEQEQLLDSNDGSNYRDDQIIIENERVPDLSLEENPEANSPKKRQRNTKRAISPVEVRQSKRLKIKKETKPPEDEDLPGDQEMEIDQPGPSKSRR